MNNIDVYLHKLYLKYKDFKHEDSVAICEFNKLITSLEGYELTLNPYKNNTEISKSQFVAVHNALKYLFEENYVQAFQEIVDFFHNEGIWCHFLSLNEYTALSLVFVVFKEKTKKG